ncbi:hypothetical protein EFK50_07765 [Nocardioides marmoriginsengisoli]|uniref:Uncharacterized protein n=1 Tax=Nocardioides marmoriginsengisoli TaxID=661483 RepID=A0A3N0CK31_9ACTN|nr:hypothetical protein [Nocardioides marmoriginsengisoli]RNL63631.1 hypothetical protein EFK50_07765 [Nocardioides marmoriginsengisoli]
MTTMVLFAVLLAAFLPLLHRDLKRADEKRLRRRIQVMFRINSKSFVESMRAMEGVIDDLAASFQGIGDAMKKGKTHE